MLQIGISRLLSSQASVAWAAVVHDADPHANQQRRGGCAARGAGDPGGHARDLWFAEGWRGGLLGVDALLDMARTSVNVLGNCLASAVVARWER